MRALVGVLLSIALGLVTYTALALTNESLPHYRLVQADTPQSDQARSPRAETDAVGLLTKRVALLEKRVEALEAKSRSADSAIPRTGPRGWFAY